MLQALIGFLSQGIGQRIGSSVANGLSLAALAPLALWLIDNKDGVAVTLTWGELALFGGFAFALVKVVHYTAAPRRPGELDNWRGGA